jgi:hypothetical protein
MFWGHICGGTFEELIVTSSYLPYNSSELRVIIDYWQQQEK